MKNKMAKRTDMKYWTGGKIILDTIKKNVKKTPKNKKFKIWRPENLEQINFS